MTRTPRYFASPAALTDAIVEAVGPKIVLGLPVGLGKAVHVANAIYERAAQDPAINLTVFTALTLEAPVGRGELEKRFLEPLALRLYGEWPVLAWADALKRETLPPNVEIREFYFRPAAYLGNSLAQRCYTSLNYTDVAGELLRLGVNVVAQLVAPHATEKGLFSLGSNPEVTLDLLPAFERLRTNGRRVALVGQVNGSMPYMFGDAELPAERLDFLLDSTDYQFPMFGIPNRAVSRRDYATAMHVASLVPDGGSLQLGIGSLSDAVAHCLLLRHRETDVFRDVLNRLPGGPASGRRPDLPLETKPFHDGLYIVTELLSDAVFALFDAGIARRCADEDTDVVMHAGFFVGSGKLYEALRTLPEARRRRIAMTAISFVNSLYGEERRKRRQRRNATFINEAMMVTLLGAAISDGLEDGRVVSGVGGQFDFVHMAQALDDARSVLMFGSRRTSKGAVRSNIVWNYGHNTIPRHCRDVFANEYGLAATRGLPDEAIVASLLDIADARFQEGLLSEAREAGKIRRTHRISMSARDNTAGRLRGVFEDTRFAPHFPKYPLGTDLTSIEQDLAAGLAFLQERTARFWPRTATVAAAIARRPSGSHAAALERLSLHAPKTWREHLLRRLVAYALSRSKYAG